SDALVSNRYRSIDDLPGNARIGTSSLRRQCQIKERFPDANILSLRGNVNTRLAKLDAGEYDAIILASAGLKRLGLAGRISQSLDVGVSLPAIGQGAIGIECRSDDTETNTLLAALHDAETGLCVSAERAMNARLQGGCQVPIAGFAIKQDGQLFMRGLVGAPDGSVLYRSERVAGLDQAQMLGCLIAEDLLSQGADRILQALFEA
ncbi:MAG: hydroxymethylbilane synthase, partial [Methylovulum sp.]|nr:hydroxymethylbilane synthase [Methylovulum sp.]